MLLSIDKRVVAMGVVLAVSFAGTAIASVPAGANEVNVGFREAESVDDRYVYEKLESELQYLNSLSEMEFDEEIEAAKEQDRSIIPRIAPLVVVGAIGCAVSAGNGIFNTDWSDGKDAAWSLAGALASCIPFAQLAKVFNVIVRNKGTIVKALQRIGAGSLAAAIAGAHITVVPE